MERHLYSIRMHASLGGRHLSGAEHLAPFEDLEELAAALVRRALTHPGGRAEQVTISIDPVVAETIRQSRLPDVRTVRVVDWEQGRQTALHWLKVAGVTESAAWTAMQAMQQGGAPDGTSMRGAMLVDVVSGERLELDHARGVRVSRMDLTLEAEQALRAALVSRNLDNPHVREALILAGKVLMTPGVVAELCWSDDPDYTAGYVAAPGFGYVRFPHLKPLGEGRGGRAFFFAREGFNLDQVVTFLEKEAVLFTRPGRFLRDMEAGE
ncbi:MAG: 6-carboxyhexanoate--CoA ligase [Desulfuromonadales bacterium GWD2_61_12]|nr:MAG: 6-carboxyhexanoate--CoA ligase [Desulfuromonadales bacterium GWD2_61_12]OGR34000.1 MAG: 6-carboxyhexanoate--CoA ligase [Desulfuromonadales bacterium GWC2_61_20]HAD03199.1 6-carboxyhexanoate--CoA ligase [Desulfuromonas sp.]HBT82389.1 6-carboxyhexanoate--CoA ligase [Desulfuromonas sp.]